MNFTHDCYYKTLKSTVCNPHGMKKTHKKRSRNVCGAKIRQARLNAKPSVSQSDLSARLSVRGVQLDRSAISRIESGERYVMDYEVQAIARSLKVRVAELYGES